MKTKNVNELTKNDWKHGVYYDNHDHWGVMRVSELKGGYMYLVNEYGQTKFVPYWDDTEVEVDE